MWLSAFIRAMAPILVMTWLRLVSNLFQASECQEHTMEMRLQAYLISRDEY